MKIHGKEALQHAQNIIRNYNQNARQQSLPAGAVPLIPFGLRILSAVRTAGAMPLVPGPERTRDREPVLRPQGSLWECSCLLQQLGALLRQELSGCTLEFGTS